ncbi:hypothetical protein GCM10007111_04380 [Virgibacillus kapii]|uniref:Uncharacterized protein n=2 Tax=Virgibacillus TaxID=84406 RepID=A0A024QCF0_9BACI|nr:hypothetical protein GCM10007111_04380 [Virgibacillus kapii]CDQ39942.1 hypothetical protein BN990_02259 [Virgibacillus massiliensis]
MNNKIQELRKAKGFTQDALAKINLSKEYSINLINVLIVVGISISLFQAYL